MATIEERIAVLEARMDRDDEDRMLRRKELDAKLEMIQKTLEISAQEMARYKGFVGGVALIISGFSALSMMFKDALAKWEAR